jgi:hypothetical protein
MAVMAPPRESWTDERLDDLAKHMDARFDAQQKYMDARFAAVDKRLDDVIRMMQIGFGILGSIMAAMLGLLGWIATQL